MAREEQPMSRLRVSILGVMVVVLLAAVGLAALRRSSPVLASTLFALVILILLSGLIAALVSCKAFWVGFAVFGWGWLVLSFGPWAKTEVPIPITDLILAEAYLHF